MIYLLYLKIKTVVVKLRKKLEKILKRKNNLKPKEEEKQKNHILFMIKKTIMKIIRIKLMIMKKIKKWTLIQSNSLNLFVT